MATVKSFATSVTQVKMCALVVQCHGDARGNILGIDCRPGRVQKLIDEICSEDLYGVPKVR